jgi:hypothetical protein
MMNGRETKIFALYNIDMGGKVLQEFGRVFEGGENWSGGGG